MSPSCWTACRSRSCKNSSACRSTLLIFLPSPARSRTDPLRTHRRELAKPPDLHRLSPSMTESHPNERALAGAKTLDVGCGWNKTPGAIGIDVNPKAHADVVHDLGSIPY